MKLAPFETLPRPSMHKHTVFMRTRRMFSALRQRVVTIGGSSVHTMMSLHYRQPACNIMTSRHFFSLLLVCVKNLYQQRVLSKYDFLFFPLQFEGENMTQIYFCVRFILPARLKLEASEQKTFWYLCTIHQTMFMTQLHTYVYTFTCI